MAKKKILFVHQNFPGQFIWLAPELAKKGHSVHALHIQSHLPKIWQGVNLVRYEVSRPNTPNIHEWALDFESKVIRAQACYNAALKLKADGYMPDIIVSHHGWGESMFLKEVWPAAKMGIYCEFFYHNNSADINFDPEFAVNDPSDLCRVLLKNINNLYHFEIADAGISPTYWQASTFPERFRNRISVIHDGIDTEKIRPSRSAKVTINNSIDLNVQSEVITFVNRNLEPYRGYHIFMRALPRILAERKKARVLIVGGDDVSYGRRPTNGRKWKDIFIEEVRPNIPEEDWSRIHFLGAIPYPTFITLLQISSVHVYLTYPFVLSWSLLEAMSAGCSIVGSDTEPVREVIEDNVTGRLVNFFDHAVLAERVCELLENRALAARLGTAARAFASDRYDLRSKSIPAQIEWLDSL